MKILVVFYSRTGNTRRLAGLLAAVMGAEVEELRDEKPREGLLGHLRSGTDAWFRRITPIHPPRHDPARFDLVVIGTPVWQLSVSSPVRAYLQRYGGRIRRVAFFCTLIGFGAERVFRQMGELCGRAPVAKLACTEGELRAGALSSAATGYAMQACLRAA